MSDEIEGVVERLDALEARVAALAAAIELTDAPAPPAPESPVPANPAYKPLTPIERAYQRAALKGQEEQQEARSRPRPLTEDLLGGRVLGIAGGVAVLLGIVFFLVLAIRRGLIDEPTRTALAGLGSLGLIGGGWWLYEKKGQTDASQITVGVGIAGLFATITTATQLYHLFSAEVGLGLAGLAGALGVVAALRLGAPAIGYMGIVGALIAPVLVDAGTSGTSLAFMGIALAASTAIVVWRDWPWLACMAFGVSFPQLGAWVDGQDSNVGAPLFVTTLFWAITLVAATGHGVRTRSDSVGYPTLALAVANAAALAGIGSWVLEEAGNVDGRTAWVFAASVVHLLLGAFGWSAGPARGIARDLAVLLLGIGTAISGVALALMLDGPALVVAWTAEAVLLAWLARRLDEKRAFFGAAAFFVIAVWHSVAVEAPPDALGSGVANLRSAVIALVVVAAAAAWGSRVAPTNDEGLSIRRILLALSALAAVYLGSVVIVDQLGDAGQQRAQTTLSAFWAVIGLCAVVSGLLKGIRDLRLAGLSLLTLSIAKVFFYDLANLSSINRALSFLAVGLLLLAGAFAYQRVRGTAGPTTPDP